MCVCVYKSLGNSSPQHNVIAVYFILMMIWLSIVGDPRLTPSDFQLILPNETIVTSPYSSLLDPHSNL